MSSEVKRTIAVVGATGAQGGSVVNALTDQSVFNVRALTRTPDRAGELGDEVVAADLTKPETLKAAFDGAYGAFVNTNSFASPDTDEVAQATAAVEAAKDAGVQHFIWSTLPDVHHIAGGKYSVPHFSNKAKVNDVVTGAGFPSTSLVQPPFYYQNLTSPMYPLMPGAGGIPTWRVQMRHDARGMHMGDINEYGNLVAGAFASPERSGDGQILSFAGDLKSWDELVSVLVGQGHTIAYEETSDDPWGIRDMFGYMEEYTYFGPDAEANIARGDGVSTGPATDFAAWAKVNMPPVR